MVSLNDITYAQFKTYKTRHSDEYKQAKKKFWYEMVSELKLEQDIDYIAFLLWAYKSAFINLINEPILRDKLDLTIIRSKLEQSTPQVEITGFAGATPLGGWRARFGDNNSYYNCLKFIGQFTNDQSTYDACMDILEHMPRKLPGPILDPPEVLYLMRYNNNTDTSRNTWPKPQGYFNKISNFYYSIYKPDPSFESEYNRYKNQSRPIFLRSKDIFAVGYLIRYKYLNGFFQDCLSDPDVISLLTEIKNETAILNSNPENIRRKINKKLRFLNPDDTQEIGNIFSDAYIYVSDSKYVTEVIRRQSLIEVYNRKLTTPDSKLSHELIREAADAGCLWIVKFLIDQGASVKDLPNYSRDQWDDSIHTKQLREILTDTVKNPCGFDREYINKKNLARAIVFKYLVDGNYI